jgi:hypothetical protein
MRIFAQRQKRTQPLSSSADHLHTPVRGRRDGADRILHLQSTIGNQAVLGLLARGKLDGLLNSPPRQPRRAAGASDQLTVGPPESTAEQEAHRVSGDVMRSPQPTGKEQGRLQTSQIASTDLGQPAAPPIVHEVLASPGHPPDPADRRFMEARFGHDFSRLRVHTDEQAARSARAIGAAAYTVGQDVVFGAGEYAPRTERGRRLLAHELTHVVQQKSGQGGSGKVVMRFGPMEVIHGIEIFHILLEALYLTPEERELEQLREEGRVFRDDIRKIELARFLAAKLEWRARGQGADSIEYTADQVTRIRTQAIELIDAIHYWNYDPHESLEKLEQGEVLSDSRFAQFVAQFQPRIERLEIEIDSGKFRHGPERPISYPPMERAVDVKAVWTLLFEPTTGMDFTLNVGVQPKED